MSATGPRFSSRLSLLLCVLGIAVGTGNIWRFPRIAAQNGGDAGAGAFLLAWIICLVTWSIPLIIAEYALGRRARKGVVGAFASAAGPGFAGLGGFVALVATAIMFYYAVVAGWCLFYLGHSIVAPAPADTEAAMATWNGLQDSHWPSVLLAVALGICGATVLAGIRSIERVNRVLVPTLLAVVVIAVVRAVTLPGAGEGLRYLFTPDFSQLTSAKLWLEALTQNAWDTGAGWGLILTYAAYMRREDYVVKNAVATGVGNNIVSLLAAVMVFCTVFAVLGADNSRAEVLAVMQESGPASTGLTFIWMPQLFATLPGGGALVILFFLGLSFAALSSLISMVELAVRVVEDAGLTRRKAVVSVVGVGFVLGLPSALSVDVLSNQDFVWGVGLMLSGLFVALAVRRFSPARLVSEVLEPIPGDLRVGAGFRFLIGYAVPLQAVVLLGWWLYLSATAYAPDTWWNPMDPYSVATCVVQWSVGGLIAVAAARAAMRRAAEEGAA